MSLRPEVVDAQGGPMTGNGSGPMPLAKPVAKWSHATGRRHNGSPFNWETGPANAAPPDGATWSCNSASQLFAPARFDVA